MYIDHKPVPYLGNEPFVFISYSHRNVEEAMDIMTLLTDKGIRIWFDGGIELGTEWAENIARHIQKCHVFVALLSQDYIESENCLDEINHAREMKKNRFLVYLQSVQLPPGLAMQLSRLQNLYRQDYLSETILIQKLISAQGITDCISTPDNFSRPTLHHGYLRGSTLENLEICQIGDGYQYRKIRVAEPTEFKCQDCQLSKLSNTVIECIGELDSVKTLCDNCFLSRKQKIMEIREVIIPAQQNIGTHGRSQVVGIQNIERNYQLAQPVFRQNTRKEAQNKVGQDQSVNTYCSNTSSIPESMGSSLRCYLVEKSKNCPIDGNRLTTIDLPVQKVDGRTKKLTFHVCQQCHRHYVFGFSESVNINDYRIDVVNMNRINNGKKLDTVPPKNGPKHMCEKATTIRETCYVIAKGKTCPEDAVSLYVATIPITKIDGTIRRVVFHVCPQCKRKYVYHSELINLHDYLLNVVNNENVKTIDDCISQVIQIDNINYERCNERTNLVAWFSQGSWHIAAPNKKHTVARYKTSNGEKARISLDRHFAKGTAFYVRRIETCDNSNPGTICPENGQFYF